MMMRSAGLFLASALSVVHGSGFDVEVTACSAIAVRSHSPGYSLLQIGKEKGHLERQLSRTVNFEPGKWNDELPLRKSHNCYEYALNDVDKVAVNHCNHLLKEHGRSSATYKKCRRYFHIPGYHYHQRGLHKAVKFNRTSVTCPNVMQRVALDGTGALIWAGEDGVTPTKDVDNRGVKSWSHDDQCPKDYYMASLVIKPHQRFHFYRRDRPCTEAKNKGKLCWSHKPGLLNVTHLDAQKNEIPDLHAADRSYG